MQSILDGMHCVGPSRALLVTVACCATSCGTRTSAPPPPAAASREMPVAAVAAVDAGPVSGAEPERAAPPALPDPLAGKSPQEQWAWAVSLVPTLSELVPRPTSAAFEPLGLKNGAITLYTPELELTLAKKQLAPCAALRLQLENGELATRIARDGSRARPDLKDNYVLFRLGLTIFDHEAVTGDLREGYADSSVGGTLSEVTSRGLRYDGTAESVAAECLKNTVTHHCRDGSTKVCETCTLVAVVPMQGYGQAAAVMKDSACGPCPPDSAAPHLEDVNRVLRAQPVMRVDKGSGPAFYVRRADCQAARRARRKKPAE